MTVRRYASTDAGAPTLSGTVGSLIGLLDAVLVNGYNVVTVSSLTRSGSVVTAVTSTPHGFAYLAGSTVETSSVARISGAVETAYNGDWKAATVVNSTTFTFDIGVATPTSPATGTINCCRAPLGWTKPHTGTNKAAYRMPLGTPQHYLRVDDSAPVATSARQAIVHGYEAMTDVDTGSGKWPNTANGFAATKNQDANANATSWQLIADERMFYLFVTSTGSGAAPFFSLAFGTINTFKPGDSYHTLLIGNNVTTGGSTSAGANDFSLTNNYVAQNFSVIARGYNQLTPAVATGKMADSQAQAGTRFGRSGLPFPSPVDNGMYLAAVRVVESSVLRGMLPGIYSPLHDMLSAGVSYVENVIGLPNRGIAVLLISDSANNGSSAGLVGIDLTGPWS